LGFTDDIMSGFSRRIASDGSLQHDRYRQRHAERRRRSRFRGWRPRRHRRYPLGQRPLPGPGPAPARRPARTRTGAARADRRSVLKRGKIESGSRARCRAGCPRRHRCRCNEVLQWCRGGCTGRAHLDEPALDAPGAASQGLREARAREGERLATMLLERIGPPARTGRPGRAAGARRWCSASSSAFWNAGTRPSQRRRRPAACRTEALQERALNEAAGLRDPHRRRRGTGPPDRPPRRDRAPAEEGRRTRQATGLPDPGTAARSQHAGQQVGGAGADQRVGGDEGR
jgi:hypothetical protein